MDPELKQLEIKRLLKKLDYVMSDHAYQSRLMSDADRYFQIEVSKLLDQFPELKTLYEEKTNHRDTEIIQVEETIEENREVKDLYRKIVKATHPDKTNDTSKNNMFDLASKAYESGDIVDMILIADNLNIDSGIEIPVDDIKKRISSIETKIEFLKKTYTWKWMNAKEDEKNNIIIEYLRQNII